MLPTNSPLDKILGGGLESNAITNIYGPPGSGKTNIAISSSLSSISHGKNVFYIDTEGSFSYDRFVQMGGDENKLKKMILVDIYEWQEQHSKIMSLETNLPDGTGLIVVDSLVSLYRLMLDTNSFVLLNKQLATQYSVLSKISRKMSIPVLVTNQVYGWRDGDKEKIEMTSRAVAKYWSRTLIELKRTEKESVRTAIIRKHRSLREGQKIDFEITKDGFKPVGKLSIF